MLLIFRSLRRKRQAGGHVCEVYFAVDHTFYQQYASRSPTTALSEAMYFLNEASQAFESVDFDGNGNADGISFNLIGVTIYETTGAAQYLMSDESLSVDDYLKKFSEYDFEDYCLAVAFSYRDFSNGVIGLAYLGNANPSNPLVLPAPGGICQDRIVVDGTPMSYNTLLVTALNFGDRLPKAVISLTLTHEFGHSFGSPHDDEDDPVCSPSGFGGKYLMHPFSTETDKANNWKFSSCSKTSINPVISDKGSCFVSKKVAFCGDAIIDEGEECDCGPQAQCDQIDPCCNPGDCTLRAGKACTPRDLSKPCCNSDCSFTLSSENKLCGLGDDCKEDSFCDGSSAVCPESQKKPDNTTCYGQNAVCLDGLCRKGICSLLGQQGCQCLSDHFLCVVCCDTGDNTGCLPFHLAGPGNTFINEIIPRMPGQACDDYHGYCNDAGTCLKTGREGADDRLNLFLTGDMIEKWFAKYLYYILASIAAIIIFSLILKRFYNDKTTLASYNISKVALLWQQAVDHHKALTQKLITLDTQYKSLLDSGLVADVDTVKVEKRLKMLFPKVSHKKLNKYQRGDRSEAEIIRDLITKGYEMKRF